MDKEYIAYWKRRDPDGIRVGMHVLKNIWDIEYAPTRVKSKQYVRDDTGND